MVFVGGTMVLGGKLGPSMVLWYHGFKTLNDTLVCMLPRHNDKPPLAHYSLTYRISCSELHGIWSRYLDVQFNHQ